MGHSDGNTWREDPLVGVLAELSIADELASDGTPGLLAQDWNCLVLAQGIGTSPSPFFNL